MEKDYDVLRQDRDRSKLPKPLYKLVYGDKEKKYDKLKQDIGEDKKKFTENINTVVDCMVSFVLVHFQLHTKLSKTQYIEKVGRAEDAVTTLKSLSCKPVMLKFSGANTFNLHTATMDTFMSNLDTIIAKLRSADTLRNVNSAESHRDLIRFKMLQLGKESDRTPTHVYLQKVLLTYLQAFDIIGTS
jgi:hypothetical protein